MTTKYVYYFGPNGTEGDASMKNTLGGKGANLAEMAKIGLPVPAGFTITTDFCTRYFEEGRKFPDSLKVEVAEALKKVESAMGMKFGDPENPLLVSCRSGARKSMPGMMETVLNVGLCSKTIPGLIKKTNNPRFVWDAYRRLIMMYSDVVMEKAEDLEVEEGKGIRIQLEGIMHELKKSKGYKSDTDLTEDDLSSLCDAFKKRIKEVLGRDFPDDPQEQLWGGIGAVFKSWNGRRAVAYRQIEGIPHEWGTATNVQSMVFGNMGKNSATGVAFSRNPATGENKFYGEWLVDAQGEDVVAGIRTPNPINEATKNEQNKDLPSLEKEMPDLYKQLYDFRTRLEQHYKDMQDIEFTIQEKKLYMLQCRNGKRTGTAALNMAMDMLEEGLIDEKTAVLRVEPHQLDELLHPVVDPNAEKATKPIVTGLPAGPGGACGKIVFSAADAVAWTQRGEKVLLVREETNPEDVEGMRAALGILTARGGMTSHAALVARGWGKCCIVGAAGIEIDFTKKTMTVGGKIFKEGDVLTLNGTRGRVYEGALSMVDATENPRFQQYMKLVDKYRTMGVRTNADTPEDARIAREFGAEGIGLFRTEHMFYGKGSDEPLFLLRKMILSKTLEERRTALKELFPFVKRDIKNTLAAMEGLPVTFRLLDPPLHEFVPQGEAKQAELAKALGISTEDIKRRGELLHETNPMMGHRGVRLGITYPEVTEMQIRAIFEATAELIKEGKKAYPELMVPVTCAAGELEITKKIFDRVEEEVEKEMGVGVECKYGTMIEIPRACLLGDEMAKTAEFFSFGTNDLTQ
ncbi:MAG: pyruvate, phosphate dikinase, partial [SAR324 cluster bacterium]|nr:pyruvate, phosphate dikinase [SAR324 cluster bacterium]